MTIRASSAVMKPSPFTSRLKASFSPSSAGFWKGEPLIVIA